MPPLTHTPTSSHIHSFSYDPDLRTLSVTFKTTSPFTVVTHQNVPLEVFTNMKRDFSAGKYYHQVVKRHYRIK